MTKQVFDVESYWRVTVYYNVSRNFFDYIADDLRRSGAKEGDIEDIIYSMENGEAKAVICSNARNHESIVLFNKHSSKADYINSIVHEAEHIKQSMLKAYRVKDKGEPPAYTVGYLVGRMWEVAKKII